MIKGSYRGKCLWRKLLRGGEGGLPLQGALRLGVAA